MELGRRDVCSGCRSLDVRERSSVGGARNRIVVVDGGVLLPL